jgi:hypothetical protein
VTASEKLERRIAISAWLVCAGLAVQSITHFWVHPLSFMSFLLFGTPLVCVGILLFLYYLISIRE